MMWRRKINTKWVAFGFNLLLIFTIEIVHAETVMPDGHSYTTPDLKNITTIPQDKTDSSTYFTNVLEKVRLNIKYDTSNYNFSQSGVNDLENLVMESGGQPVRNLVVSTWRSGSTFLGDLVSNVFPSTYYTPEPLIMYKMKQFRTPNEVSKALSIVKQMLNCNYEGLDDYFDFVKKYLDGNWTQYNSHNVGHHRTTLIQYSQKCKNENIGELCYNAEFASRLCKLYPFQSTKIIRLRLKFIEELLYDKAVVRFEELALQPNITTDQILNFLKAKKTKAFDDFLQSHTNMEVAGPNSSFRVSRNVPYKWKNTLDFMNVSKIQMACREAMHLWGYKMALNETHMTSKDFDPIENYTI